MIPREHPDELVHLDFYDGAYGPTLRVGIPSRRLLEKVEDVLRSLIQGRATEVHLAGASFVLAGNVATFDLTLGGGGNSKVLRLRRGASFIWTNSVDGWQHCLDLLEGFRDEAGHQYLTAEGVDDALVEVAFLEA
jgi:hypothetical protein